MQTGDIRPDVDNAENVRHTVIGVLSVVFAMSRYGELMCIWSMRRAGCFVVAVVVSMLRPCLGYLANGNSPAL